LLETWADTICAAYSRVDDGALSEGMIDPIQGGATCILHQSAWHKLICNHLD